MEAKFAASEGKWPAATGPGGDYVVAAGMRPKMWFPLGEVWEVKGADITISPVHTAATGLVSPEQGLSLRFPRFVRVRPDKTPHQATTAAQLAHMFTLQNDRAPQ